MCEHERTTAPRNLAAADPDSTTRLPENCVTAGEDAQAHGGVTVQSAFDDDGAVERVRFETSMGREATLRIIELFQQQLADRFHAESSEALASDAHQICGSAGLLGLEPLAVAAQELERACLEGRSYEAALSKVRRLVGKARPSLELWRSRVLTLP